MSGLSQVKADDVNNFLKQNCFRKLRSIDCHIVGADRIGTAEKFCRY